MSRDVVITGVGAVTPLGVGARTLHERWGAGGVGIEDGKGAARSSSPRTTCRSRRPAAPTASRSSRSSRATRRWPRRAGATSCPTTPTASAAILGTGIGGIGTLERGKELLIESGPKKVPPLSVPLMMSNAAAARCRMRYGLLGPCYGIVSACSAGADAIGAAEATDRSPVTSTPSSPAARRRRSRRSRWPPSTRSTRCRTRASRARSTRAATASSWARAPASWCSRTPRRPPRAARRCSARCAATAPAPTPTT